MNGVPLSAARSEQDKFASALVRLG
jgi:hypothetical protein